MPQALAQRERGKRAAASWPSWRAWLLALGIVALAAGTLAAFGRTAICTCGDIKLWHGVVMSAENSQHVTDWYTFSHVIHGFGLYGLLWLFARPTGIGVRLVLATALESAWEVVENTDVVINRYREATIALDYYGDSILNSVSDIGAMLVGFLLAARLPVKTTLLIAVVFEVVVGVVIRDNLTLNILMLVFPVDAVRQWQLGG